MTDKVQKIKDWIQTRKLCTMDGHMKFYCKEAESDYNLLCSIEKILDSLQEEPVSEGLEEALKCKVKAIFDSLEKFDVNDKEKNRVAFGLIQLEAYAKMFYNIGKQAGAQWQKQQMMRGATDGQIEIGEDYLRIKCLCMSCPPQYDGKLVRLIIIREGLL